MYDFDRKKSIFNNKNFLYLIFDIVLISIGIVLLIHRSLYGIDFTDQSWYVAEPYIVSEGAIPYANNWSQAPGFTIPLAWFTKLYTFFSGGTEGIFLFSRIEYIVWLTVMVGLICFAFNQSNDKYRIPIIMILPLLFITPGQLFSINYNTIGLVYLFLVSVIIFVDFKDTNTKMQFIRGIISGLIIARAIIGTPYIMLPCVMIFLYLLKVKEWKKLQGFICGGVLMAILVVGWCCFRAGTFEFIKGLQYWLHDCGYFKIEGSSSLNTNLIELFSYLKMFILCMVCAYIARKVLRADEVYEKFLYMLLCGILIAGCLQYLYTNNFKTVVYWGWFEPIILYLFSPDLEQKKNMKIFSFIIALYSSVFIFSSFGNISGFGSREYWLYIPLILSFIVVFSWNMELIRTQIILRFGIVILTFLMIRLSYSYVYRDEPVNCLTEKVESGVWKGLYTTKEKAQGVVELEDCIKRMTKKEDNVLFQDWVSFGYLMNNGKACTPSALDSMQYTYNINDPQIMYDYFSMAGKVPDKIIYIDFGRDEMLSIEDRTQKFNQFVDYNYNLQSETELKMFRILLYKLKSEEKTKEMSKGLMFWGDERNVSEVKRKR